MALDPITQSLLLLKGGTALAKGIGGFIGGRKQAEAELERASTALTKAEGLQEQALAAREDYGLGESFSDLRQLVMQDPASDYLRQQQLRSEATQLDALAGGGARALLGGTQAVSQRSMDELARIADEEQQRKAQGLQIVGQAEQRVAEERLADARTDLALGRGMEAEALAAQYGAEDLRRLANQAAFQTGVDALKTGAMVYGNQEVEGGGTRWFGDKGLQGYDPYLLNLMTGYAGITNPFADTQVTNNEDGGVVRGKTPGEFSHEKNPIDIVQNGDKIGEMTGGEGIVSPEDLGKLQQLAGKGDTELHKFVRSLISKLESNVTE